LIETAVVVGCVGVVVALAEPGGQRRAARQAQDAAQVRAVHQGMVLWAQNNGQAPRLALAQRADAGCRQ
jgi:hypothetical protein